MVAGSLSARRAWIEMLAVRCQLIAPWVALRKESVDRNIVYPLFLSCCPPSLSARRAWIEIIHPTQKPVDLLSLSARRAWIEIPNRGRP